MGVLRGDVEGWKVGSLFKVDEQMCLWEGWQV